MRQSALTHDTGVKERKRRATSGPVDKAEGNGVTKLAKEKEVLPGFEPGLRELDRWSESRVITATL